MPKRSIALTPRGASIYVPVVPLVQAARHTVLWAKRNPDTKLGHWINQIMQRRGMQKGTVAVAHKLARISWILLQREQEFKVL